MCEFSSPSSTFRGRATATPPDETGHMGRAAKAVTDAVQVARLPWVVGQSDSGCADLRDEAEVAIVITPRRSPTVIEQVLMAVDAMEVEIIPVQEKALFCIDSERSETEWLNDHVARLAAGRDNRVRRVDVRIVAALPQMRIGDVGLDTERNGRLGFGVDDGIENRQDTLVGADDGRLHLDVLGRTIAIVDVAAKRQRR